MEPHREVASPPRRHHDGASAPTLSPSNRRDECCSCPPSKLIQIDNPAKGLHVDVHRGLFATRNLDATENNWHQKILSNVRWHRVKYKSERFQKECETPCWTAFYGGRSEYTPYTPIPSWFQPLIDHVTSHLTKNGKKVAFNAFLLRLYFDGKDEIAWHTDGRTFLGEEPTVASLSLGSRAKFQLRRMNNVWPCADGSQSTEGCIDSSTPIQSFALNDGDLLVMRGKTQKHWHHRVPKEKGRGVRLNINFRYVMPGPDAERGQRTYYKYMVYGDCPMDGEPPSWTFDEIMAKRGGMMNFVQKGIKRKAKGITCSADEKNARTGEHKEPDITALSARVDSNNDEMVLDEESETQQYLASDQSVDPEMFEALPADIQNELVTQWKSQRTNSATVPRVASTAGAKREPNSGGAAGKRKKGTIDSFFARE